MQREFYRDKKPPNKCFPSAEIITGAQTVCSVQESVFNDMLPATATVTGVDVLRSKRSEASANFSQALLRAHSSASLLLVAQS